MLGSLMYEMSIVIEKEEYYANAIQMLCLILLILITSLSAIAFWIIPYLFPALIENSQVQQILPLGIVIIFTSGLYNIINFRLNREGEYSLLAKGSVIQRTGTTLVQITMGICGASVLGLILGNILGSAIAITTILALGWKKCKLTITSKKDLLYIAKKHYRFPLYTAPQKLCNAVSQYLPIYMLGYYYGIETVGFYWFAMRIIQLPVNLFGQAVRQVFYRESASQKNNITVTIKLYTKSTLLLTSIIVIPVIVIFLYGSTLFSFVFGKEWALAGEYAEWMFLGVALTMINPPATSILYIFEKQRFLLIYDIILLLVRFMALFFCGTYTSSINTIILYTFVGFAFNLFIIMYVFFFLHTRQNHNQTKQI